MYDLLWSDPEGKLSMLHSYHCSNLILLCLFTDIQGLGVSPTVPEEQASYLVKML